MQDRQSVEALLKREVAVLEELVKLSLAKKDALLSDDLNSLEAIVLKEEALAKNLKMLDDACSQQVKFFLRAKSGNQAGPELSGEAKETIAAIHKLIRELKINNELNQGLIKDSLSIIQFTMNALVPEVNSDNGIYSSAGKVVNNPKLSKKTMILDYKG